MTDSIWFSLRRELEQSVSDEEFQTWFKPLRVSSEEPRRLVLTAPNRRFVNTLEESYRKLVDRAVKDLRGTSYEVLFSVDDKGTQGTPTKRSFNPKYRFDSFVVGSSNQFASAAARAVAESPGQSYNPLFLYGGVGLGKTHLLHAIAQEIEHRQPQSTVRYLSAEQFVNELINSIRYERMSDFRERYRNIDVLLIDDIQFLANKERTQEEFFHTFNTLYTSQRQIILSSDSSPKNIPTLEERLRSRFEWGLIADIQPPDLETKVAILRRKADTLGVDLPDSVAHFISQQVRSNIRELEGMLNRVVAFSSLTGRDLDLDLARETLRDVLPPEERRLSASEIVKKVAHHYSLKVREIKSKNNSKHIAFPRQIAMYLCKQLTELSYPEIGKLFGDKHHSTVMYSVDKIDKLRVSDPDLEATLQRLRDQLS